MLRLVRAGILVFYVKEDAVPQEGSHTHDAQWGGDPDTRYLQSWDSRKKEEGWLVVGATE